MNKKLKIAMIGQKRCPSRDGGVEVVVEELSTRLVEQGHQVTCYNRKSRKDSDEVKHLKSYKGITLKNVFTIDRRGFAAISSSFFAACHAAISDYDVVHFHAEGPSFMSFIPKLFGKKVIVTIHGLDWARSKWKGLATTYLRLGEKHSVKYADEIIVLSQNVVNYFITVYGRKTHFIPNGVNSPVRHDVDLIDKQYGLKGNDYILFLARLVPEKGVLQLIETYKKVKTDKKLVIAGGSSDSDEFTKLLHIRAKDDPRIIFTGFVKGQMLEELYSHAYTYALPSEIEGMPITLLEALSYGNCCLTSNIPECVEVLGNKGLTFEKNNTEDLYQKLQFICDTPEVVENYKAIASADILNKYSWNYAVEKTLELYKK